MRILIILSKPQWRKILGFSPILGKTSKEVTSVDFTELKKEIPTLHYFSLQRGVKFIS